MESPEAISLDFKKYWLSLKRRWLPAMSVLGCVIAIAAVQAFAQKPSYEAQGKLLIKRTDQASSLTGVGQQIGQLDTLDQKSSPINTEIEVIRSSPLLQKTITTLDLRDKRHIPLKPEELALQIKLKNLTATDILHVSYTSGDPKKAAAVVNKLMSLYIENNVLTNRAEAVAASDFIAKQLPATEATVRRAELALRQFKEQNHVVALNEEASSEVTAMQKLESEIANTRAQLADENAQYTDLQQKVGMSSQDAIAIDSLNNSAGLEKLLEDLQQMEGQLAQEQTRFLDTHPTVEVMKAKREALKALVQKQVEQFLGQKPISAGDLQIGSVKQQVIEDFVASEVKCLGLASHLASLSSTLVTYQQRTNLLPKLEQDQRELQRQVEAAQSTYEILLKRLQEVRVAENQNVGNARIIEAALVPEKPSNGKKKIILALGGVLGILLSTATVVILEVIDTSIKTLKEAKDAFGYTLLGAIPALRKKAPPRRRNAEWTVPELPVRETPRSAIAETYRMLQANLKFLTDKPLQIIVVTSSVPKEGKSTVSANLAAAMAQLGRRVLLVDADMHHPMQHHIWELTNAAGLSDVIVGQAEFKTAVNQAMDNLCVLTCGVIPPNPLALLDSKRMASLIEDFSAIYDFVIIDAPPLILAADALTLGKMTDGVLLVARPGVVNSTSAAGAKELLERSSQKVLGLAINGVIVENEPDSYFYYAKEYSAGEDFNQKVADKSSKR